MCCLLKWDLFQWENIYYLFVCLWWWWCLPGKVACFRWGELFSTPIILSPLCIMEQHDLEIGIQKSLGVTNSQPSEKAMALLGFPNSICKANGIVAVKHHLQRKLKEQKGRNCTCVWGWLWMEQIHPKRCVEENAAKIRDMKRGHNRVPEDGFLEFALKNLQEFNCFQLVWSAFLAFLDRVFPDYLPYNTNC